MTTFAPEHFTIIFHASDFVEGDQNFAGPLQLLIDSDDIRKFELIFTEDVSNLNVLKVLQSVLPLNVQFEIYMHVSPCALDELTPRPEDILFSGMPSAVRNEDEAPYNVLQRRNL